VNSLLAALIMGLLQGVLEWLPVSSQGNLVLLAIAFLGLDPGDALTLSVYLHVGTGLAALVYFREDLRGLLASNSEEDRALLRFLFTATVATAVAGLPIYAFVRLASFYGDALLALTGVALLATGLMQRSRKSGGTRAPCDLVFQDGVALGLVQGFAAIPGLSRSGVTTTALLVKGLSGDEAFRVSFLMSIPAVFAAAAAVAVLEGLPPVDVSILVALVASFVAALVSIDLLMRVARRVRFWKLCIALGLIALIPIVAYLL